MALSGSTGSILGGASNAIDAAAMRAARLARLDVHSNIRPSNLLFSQEQEVVPSDVAVAGSELLVAANNSAASPPPATGIVAIASTDVLSAPDLSNTGLQVQHPLGLESMPEGAFLRITAQLDLRSAGDLVAAGAGTGETLPVALRALRGAIDKAKKEHQAATAAIEAERAEDLEQHNAQSQVMAQVMGLLAPLRTGRTAERHGEQLQELFGLLEQGATGPSERESEFQMREAEAAAALLAFDVAARSHVAAGDLHAITA
jgi:hypothetical protein